MCLGLCLIILQGLAKSQLGSCVMLLVAGLMPEPLRTDDLCRKCGHECMTQPLQVQQHVNTGQQHKLVMTLKEDKTKEYASQRQFGGKPKGEMCWSSPWVMP